MMSDYECETTCPHRDRLQSERDRLRATLNLVVCVANARDGMDYTWAWEHAMALLRELPPGVDEVAAAGWYEEHDSDDPILPLQGEPDHWMPLPKPPKRIAVSAPEERK